METFGQKQTLENQVELVGFDKGEFICCFHDTELNRLFTFANVLSN